MILVSPGWTTYAPQARLAKQKSFVLQTSMDQGWKVTPETLTQFCMEFGETMSENRLMVLNNPGNPCKT